MRDLDAAQRLAEMAIRLRKVSAHFQVKQKVPWADLLGVLKEQLVRVSISLDRLVDDPESGSLEVTPNGGGGGPNVCHTAAEEALELSDHLAEAPTDAELLREIGLILQDLGDLIRDCPLPPPDGDSSGPPFMGRG